jgi:hypothetical protein
MILNALAISLACVVAGCAEQGSPDEGADSVPATTESELTAGLPRTVGVPFVRADFSNDASWRRIKEVVGRPNEEDYQANVEYVDDRTLEGLDQNALVARFPRMYPDDYKHPVVFVADAVAMATPDYAILVIDVNTGGHARTFRAIPPVIANIEANLSISNMDF